MKQIKLKDNAAGTEQVYNIPESWDDVSWDQYQDYTLLSTFDFDNNYDRALAQQSALTGMPQDTLRNTDYELVMELLKLVDFRKNVPEPQPIAHVLVGPEVYYAQRLHTMLELAVYDRIMAESGPIETKIPQLLSILLRKRLTVTRTVPRKSFWGKLLRRPATQVVETQEAEPFLGLKEIMDDRARLFSQMLSVTQVQALAAFFLSSGRQSQSVTLYYSNLVPRLTRQTKSLETVYHAIMDGTRQYGVLTPILLTSLRCYFSLLHKYLHSSNITRK